MPKKIVKDGIAASFTVHRASDMTAEGRKKIAKWLRNCASMLLREGKNYSKRFTASYRY